MFNEIEVIEYSKGRNQEMVWLHRDDVSQLSLFVTRQLLASIGAVQSTGAVDNRLDNALAERHNANGNANRNRDLPCGSSPKKSAVLVAVSRDLNTHSRTGNSIESGQNKNIVASFYTLNPKE